MLTPRKVLHEFWNYQDFRPLQENIIQAALDGKDVLALLPTGGGKSICFQVPALCMDGICIVISPLIALMCDQVNQLKKRNIPALAIYSGMTTHEIDLALDNCIYGRVRFLYTSPERLQSELFLIRVKKMRVNLLAVDEAHCVSQWGYDFRPPYLRIAEFRKLFPQVNILALTATATQSVKSDIIEKLEFRDYQVFQKSFSRLNLSYSVREVEYKPAKLLDILKKVPGSAIIYVRSRKRTKYLAELLLHNNISADYYHAGLSNDVRASKQKKWIVGKTRVMIATNAFGMGIDKANVRLVVHYELPDSLEAYYQEAGRAGRDEKLAFAVAVINKHESKELEKRLQQNYPSIDEIKRVYQALANYFKVAVGSAEMQSYDFDMESFCENYKFTPYPTYQVLKRLQEEGFIELNEGFYKPAQLYIKVDQHQLYKFQVANERYDNSIKFILRKYGGELFNNYMGISESIIARQLNTSPDQIKKILIGLTQQKIVDYQPTKDKAQVTFLHSRYDANKLPLNLKRLEALKQKYANKIRTVVNYVDTSHRCRTQMLLEYFGESDFDFCGICDWCLNHKKNEISQKESLQIKNQILDKIKLKPQLPSHIAAQIADFKPDEVSHVIRQMVEKGQIHYDKFGKLSLIN